MTDHEVPEPWASWAEQRGVRVSFNGIADRAGIAVETARTTMLGLRQRPKEPTLRALADALGRDIAEVRKAAGVAATADTPFTLPAEADRLSRRQRDAVLAVVRAMLEPQEVRHVPPPMTLIDTGQAVRRAARKRE